MTTIVAVRRDGVLSLAADTLCVHGDQSMSVNHYPNCQIIDINGSLLGITGSSSMRLAVEHYFANNPEQANFGSVQAIYEAWLHLHAALRSDYFLMGADDDDTSYESSGMDAMIANETGAYVASGYRSVYEILRYHAIGMGDQYALGAMHALYAQEALSAQDIALGGITAAAEFHVGTALPATVFTVRLAGAS
jgi:ATP-dependent HslUV protease subunit HslV